MIVVVMVNNPTTKTLMKLTMSMTTPLTTVQHRVLRIAWSCSPFPLHHLFVFNVFLGLHGVAVSSWQRGTTLYWSR